MQPKPFYEVCAVHVRVWEKGWFFLGFIVFLTNLLIRLEKVVMTDEKKLNVIEKKEKDSELEEMKNFYAEITHQVGRLRTKVSSA